MIALSRAALFALALLASAALGIAPSCAADYPNRPVRWLIGFSAGGPVDVDMVHVPYRGSAIAFPDVISNKVQLIFDNLPTAMEQARSGNMRALGVTSPQRWPSLPEIPAIAETVPGYESAVFYGMSAPKGTPPEIVDILNKAVNEVLKDPKLVARFATIGGVPKPMTPAGYGKLIADETEKWRKVVEFAGVSVD